MTLYKFHGAGNDFVLCDMRYQQDIIDAEIIARLCHRHFGIGADGFIKLERGTNNPYFMRYYNADGGEASMCGNGARCFAAFVSMLGLVDQQFVFEASDGIHEAQINDFDNLNTWSVSVEIILSSTPILREDGFWYANTGVPHLIIPSENLNKIDVNIVGKKIRHLPSLGPDGANVNFIELQNNILHIRTFERGVEAETLACGTGITASALAMAVAMDLKSPVSVSAKGGDLMVYFNRHNRQFTDIKLLGPAQFVFSTNLEFDKP